MYGMIEATRHAHAAHARRIPLPTSTVIPNGTGDALGTLTVNVLMSWAFLTMTVHITAPMRSRTAPMTAKIVEVKKPNACLSIPLSQERQV